MYRVHVQDIYVQGICTECTYRVYVQGMYVQGVCTQGVCINVEYCCTCSHVGYMKS